MLATLGIGQLVQPGAVDSRQPALSCRSSCGRLFRDPRGGPRELVVFNGVRWLGPTRVITIQALVPAFAVILAFVFLGEPIRIGQVVGGAIILGGVALTRIASRRPTVPAVRRMTSDPGDVPGLRPPVPPLRPGDPPLAILVDYDGTIALTDVSDTVMAEFVHGDWEQEVVAYDAGLIGSRRLMTLEMAMVDTDTDALFEVAAAQPHDAGFVPFARRAMAAGIPVEVVSDGFGFFIEPALVALGVGDIPVVTARTTFQGRRAAHRLPERPPDVPRLRDLQAPARAGAPGGRPRGRVHRRRRERPLRRRVQRRGVRQAVAGAHLPGGRLGVPALDRVRRDRRVADRDARRLAGGSGVAARPAARGRSSAARRSGARAARTRCPGTGRRPR